MTCLRVTLHSDKGCHDACLRLAVGMRNRANYCAHYRRTLVNAIRPCGYQEAKIVVDPSLSSSRRAAALEASGKGISVSDASFQSKIILVETELAAQDAVGFLLDL